LPMKEAAMPVRPIHHRRNAEAPARVCVGQRRRLT
jgi:hypothetical protein